jgi:hypothetical protein
MLVSTLDSQLYFVCVVQALSESGSFNAQELSLVCWALARLGHSPPVPWLVALLADGLELQGGLGGQSVVLLMQALAKWDLRELKEAGKHRCEMMCYVECFPSLFVPALC